MTVYVIIECDSCEATYDQGDTDKRKALRHAREEGWNTGTTGSPADLCPGCWRAHADAGTSPA